MLKLKNKVRKIFPRFRGVSHFIANLNKNSLIVEPLLDIVTVKNVINCLRYYEADRSLLVKLNGVTFIHDKWTKYLCLQRMLLYDEFNLKH